ncbi:chromosomal replication initiator protein DnaA [Buchnera aphidicola str. Bp (Baizongia pistaciae)]|uniref:Chromosomal replication initiator protein DnaA n=1 Tax=Buchnera aphidicola subsp. Baizongia pistaciae (strain Bp) TaxID=224915 RepID=DNAA_BUCBP|nr:chromosomal replication initiator protein DnaA [Buchnera aphidicola]P59567.1 RecName: Full=Chromosomal replication initiator protein DnaA [Buchnera aphidicola str. Bp (Baizongia pistaciae)]AAO26756.1 chromosomal replication initiator protein DnaA [Buchnera aphidicola str. Bp (Baizongia pistaciae)]
MSPSIWEKCLKYLQNKLSPIEFSMWIRPLKAEFKKNILILYAPNEFSFNWIKDNYIENLKKLLKNFCNINTTPTLMLKICKPKIIQKKFFNELTLKKNILNSKLTYNVNTKLSNIIYSSEINTNYTFQNFTKGQSNQLAFKTIYKIAHNPGKNYFNPLFLYGKSGLGKTHLLHAVANTILKYKNTIKIIYINSENFIQNMITSLKNNTIEEFKKYYRSVNTLLIDDIQFFAYKKHSQEELFHTINALLNRNQQIIITSDQFPQKIHGIETRLKSRFECGLTIRIDPPDLNTRTKILIKKSHIYDINLSYKVAFFIAKNLKSNIRELEGALNKILANSDSKKKIITINFAYKTLQELFSLPKKSITIKNIQKVVSNYYHITIINLLSQCRLKSIVKPRQIAMAISKKLTNKSLSEIGREFNGRNHATVLYACKKIKKLQEKNNNIKKDFLTLLKILSS